jgi:head-tail adaptor
MPTLQQIARIQRYVSRYLTETAVIQRRGNAVDSAGVPDGDSWLLVAESVACRVIDARSQMSHAWKEVAQTDAMIHTHRVIFPVGTDVTGDCRVLVGGRVYHVVQVLNDRTDAVDMQVHVKQIEGNDGEV